MSALVKGKTISKGGEMAKKEELVTAIIHVRQSWDRNDRSERHFCVC
jgi:hypothetical protein